MAGGVNPTLAIADGTATEGDAIDLVVSLSAASSSVVTVDYATSNGTASSGTDYTSDSGTLTFAVGETSKTISIVTVDDSDVESAETVTLTLSNPSNATLATAVGTGTINNNDGVVPTVTNSTTGDTWMDRNLGASQVATSSTDADAYGDLYQWGRGADGHEDRSSSTTATLSTTDEPGHGDFITTSSSPYDWRSGQNDNLWQGVAGTNNPCPAGFRLPNQTELANERASWSSDDAAGAYASTLKLVLAGYRYYDDGTVYSAGSYGSYWSSTVNGSYARNLAFASGGAGMGSSNRADGFSVRCIED